MSTQKSTQKKNPPDSLMRKRLIDELSEIKPSTALGRDLLAIRRRIIQSGVPLLDDEELEQEIAERRGGYYRGDRDI